MIGCISSTSRKLSRELKTYAGGEEYFLEDRKAQDAVLRNLHTLAESSQRISGSLKEQYPEVDWRILSAFRNVVVHDYLGISLNRVWDIVENDLPSLKEHIAVILKTLA